MATGNSEFMSSSRDEKAQAAKPQDSCTGKPQDPEWASGLKKLYESVVDEPLPDSFKDLLSRLDEHEGK